MVLLERYEALKNGLDEINNKLMENNVKRENILLFISTLEKSEALLTGFDEGLWNATIEKVVINSERDIRFVFKDGMDLEWNI